MSVKFARLHSYSHHCLVELNGIPQDGEFTHRDGWMRIGEMIEDLLAEGYEIVGSASAYDQRVSCMTYTWTLVK